MKNRHSLITFLDNSFEELICTSCLIVLSLCVITQVILRFIFNNASAWAEEVAIYAMIYAIYFGASMAIKSKDHIRITYFLNKLGRSKIFILMIGDILWLSFVAFLFYQTSVYTKLLFEITYISPGLNIDLKWLHLVIPLVLLLMVFRLLQSYFQWYKNKFEGLPS